jgi:hypothetical protein
MRFARALGWIWGDYCFAALETHLRALGYISLRAQIRLLLELNRDHATGGKSRKWLFCSVNFGLFKRFL